MPRLFVALTLPEPLKARLVEIRDPAPKARWTPAENLHLTLRFVGPAEAALAARIEAALAGVEAASFVVRGYGLGVFPSMRRPRVLFAGIERSPPLADLAGRIEKELRALGLPPADKPFHPHVTLARLRRPDAQRVRALLRQHQDFVVEPFAAEAFHLFESQTHPDGARYRRRASYRLH